MLANIVKMEADIRAAQVELDTVGLMVENKRCTQIPNSLISVIDTLERCQLAVIRSMSLNQKTHYPRTIDGTAKVESETRAALKDVGVAGLIAQPKHWIGNLRYYTKNCFELLGFVYSILLKKAQFSKHASIIATYISTE